MNVKIYLALILSLIFLSSCQEQRPIEPPQDEWRIVTIAPSTASILVALGLKKNIVGVSEWCSVKELNNVTRVGSLSAPSLEKIVTVSPNIILGQGAQKTLEQFCKNYRIYYRQFNTDSIQSWEEEVITLGNIFNKKKEAATIVESFNKNFPAKALGEGAPTCLIVASRRDHAISDLLVAGKKSFLSELLKRAGAKNIIQDNADYIYLQKELLFELNPDFIIELHANEVAEKYIKKLWNKAFPELTSQIKIISNSNILMPGASIIESAKLLKQAIHG